MDRHPASVYSVCVNRCCHKLVLTGKRYDAKGANLGGDGGYYYYPHSGIKPANNEWIYIRFTLGKDHKKHHQDAKYLVT